MQTHYEKYGRKWYEQNKQKNLERGRKWQANNRGRAVEIVQAYVRRNKKKVADYNTNFDRSVAGKYRLAKYRHTKRGWADEFLTLEDFSKLFNAECFYCGSTTNGGLDRVDNTRGYSNDNVVPCCELCNHMKWDISQVDFLSHINKIFTYERNS